MASGNPEFEKDDLVVGLLIWGEDSVLKGEHILRKLDPMGFPLHFQIGILGNYYHYIINIIMINVILQHPSLSFHYTVILQYSN